MTVTVHLNAQLRAAVNAPSVRVEVSTPATMLDVAQALVVTHPTLRPLVFKNPGQVNAGLLVICRDEQVDWTTPLNADAITLLSAISGG